VAGPYGSGMPRLVLWDVDHTLIENAGVSKEIYATAFHALTGDRASRADRGPHRPGDHG
jgi:hypothetical protein